MQSILESQKGKGNNIELITFASPLNKISRNIEEIDYMYKLSKIKVFFNFNKFFSGSMYLIDTK